MLPYFKENDGEAVFRKEIDVPVSQAGKDLILALGSLDDFDNTYVNGVEIGHTGMETATWRLAPRNYLRARETGQGRAGISSPCGSSIARTEGGFVGNGSLPDTFADRPGPQATGVAQQGLRLSLRTRSGEVDSLGYYHPDYRTDFPMGDNPYRYYRW